MDAEALTGWLDERVADHSFGGVALIWRDGGPVYCYAGGVAERRFGAPITHDTRFGVASITKLVVSTTCLQLVDRGELSLTHPILDVLAPEHRTRTMTPKHTLHHLLSHTSGLPNYHDDDAQDWDSFLAAWDRLPTYHARGPADMLPLFAELPAEFEPGAKHAYADANFLLAGLLIEDVTGRRWQDVAAEQVLMPAGMVDTGVPNLDDDPYRLATGYIATDEPPQTWRSNMFGIAAGGMPDGGLVTTATDLARFIDAFNAGTLLPAELMTAMTTPRSAGSNETESYGYGCGLGLRDGRVVVYGHSGLDPGNSGDVSHFVESGVTTVVLCNQDRGCWSVVERLVVELDVGDPRSEGDADD